MNSQPVQAAAIRPPVVHHRADAPFPAARRMGIRSLILLGGSVRPTPFSQAIGRSVLDLPVQSRRSILDLWLEEAGWALELRTIPQPEVRVLVNRAGVSPRVRSGSDALPVIIQTDPMEFRGTAGLLRDVAGHYAKDDYIVVGNASAVLLQPLPPVVQDLRQAAGDVALLTCEDGSPLDLMVLRCGCLEVIPPIGFCDLKEQGLSLMSRKHQVRVVSRRDPTSMSARTLRGYISALRCYHRGSAALGGADAFEEDWKPLFSICEEGAEVHPSAGLHDAVVLAGGRVERGATVARSVVCPGGVVPAGRVVVDAVVAGGRQRQ